MKKRSDRVCGAPPPSLFDRGGIFPSYLSFHRIFTRLAKKFDDYYRYILYVKLTIDI